MDEHWNKMIAVDINLNRIKIEGFLSIDSRYRIKSELYWMKRIFCSPFLQWCYTTEEKKYLVLKFYKITFTTFTALPIRVNGNISLFKLFHPSRR